MWASALLTLALLQLAAAEVPHIFFVLVDDLGWGNVGFNRAEEDKEVVTPTIDGLAEGGVKLARHYVHMTCTPTRTSFQSGRLPAHVTLKLKNPEDPSCGMARNMTGIAQVMKRAGYKTHIVGKWDVGMATPTHTPLGRGYDSSLGYFEHKNDFWTMKCMQSECTEAYDLWDTDKPAPGLAGSMYEEQLFEERVVQIIKAHDPQDPLFLVYTPHVAHCPLQIPADHLAKFASLTNGTDEQQCQAQTPSINPSGSKYACRAQYHAMVNYLDNVLANVTGLLKQRGLWDKTLMVMSSDNGAPMKLAESGSNNWPLRGGKYSPWEGGIRAAAFMAGGWLPSNLRGTRQEGMMHIVDWYATFAHLAGQDPTDTNAAKYNLPPIDSINMWPMLTLANTTSPRVEIPVEQNLLVTTKYKLILGKATFASWGGPHYPNQTSHNHPVEAVNAQCGNGCLYDVVSDWTEQKDLAPENPDIVQKLTSRLQELRSTFWENNETGTMACPPNITQPCACWMAAHKYGGFMGPYQEVTV